MSIEQFPVEAPRLQALSPEHNRSLDEPDLAHELALICRAVARVASEYLVDARTLVSSQTTSEKASHHDPVTKFDKQVEASVSDILAHLVPGSRKLGEEHGEEILVPLKTEPSLPEGIVLPNLQPHVDARSLGSRVRWIIDPIDGTSNFAAGLTDFNTSIAAELDGSVIAGAVHVPCANETFWANQTEGWLETRDGFFALDSNGPTAEKDAVLLTYFPTVSELRAYPDTALDVMRELSFAFRAIRRPGAAALDLAHLAAGRAGAFFATSLKPWDVAAAVHLVKVSGGTIDQKNLGTDVPAHLGPAVAASAASFDSPTLRRVLTTIESVRRELS
ncbi:MAG: inositol monophosphatase family protein [Actinomycetaceae bacterium]|nr:inositol monophosphatase family protein [Actinomycetaceae bacterium]